MEYNQYNSEKFHKDSTIETKWNNLAGDKAIRPYQLWEHYSKITTGTTLPLHACEPDGTKVIPQLNLEAVKPEEGSSDLPNSAIENFTAKLQKTLFPDNRAFFAFNAPEEAKVQSGADKTDINRNLESAVNAIMTLLKDKKLYSILPKVFENATVIGNALVFMGYKKSDPIQFISPADFVWRRTASGTVKELIIREVIALEDIVDKELRRVLENDIGYDMAQYKTETNNLSTQPRSIQKYTYVYFEDNGTQVISEYVGKFKVGKEIRRSAKEPLFLPIAPDLPLKAQYGVGKVKGAVSSILQIRSASKTWARHNSLISDLKIGVAPSASNAIKAMAKQRTSNHVVLNDPKDMQLMPWGNVNMSSVEMSYENAKQDLSRIFLMQQGVTRQAERVTAEEIRRNAEELNAANSNLISAYESQLQGPLVQYALYHLDIENEEGDSIKDALEDLDVKLLTGTEAIGRVSQSDNVTTMLQEATLLGGVPEHIARHMKINNILNILAQGRGLPSDEIVKSKQELQAEQEAAQEQQAQLMAQEQTTKALAGNQGNQ